MSLFARLRIALVATAALGATSVISSPPSSAPVAHAAVATAPAAFTAISPCRLVDTRVARNRARVGADRSVDVEVRDRCGVPATASVVAVTVTAIEPLGEGFLTVFPTGEPQPDASVVNYRAGDVIASQQFVPVGADDSISVYSRAASHLIVDVAGYFEPVAGSTTRAGRFVPIRQRRLIDTRDTSRPRAGATLRVDPGLGDDAASVVVNVTTTETLRPGYFSTFPVGSAATNTSMLNVDRRDQTRAAATVVRLVGGEFDVFTSGGDHVIVDLVGYFTNDSAPRSGQGLFVGMTAQRLVDTRRPYGPDGGPRLWDRGARELDVTGVVGRNASAIAASIAVTGTEDPGFAVLHPAGDRSPNTSTVNYDRGQQTIANSAIVRVSDRGVTVRAHEATHVVIDVSGWFTGEPKRSDGVGVRNDPPADRTVTIISDSAGAGIRWNGALGGLQGFRPVALLESCRRLVAGSCRGREGYAPRTVLREIGVLPAAGPEDMLVIATGYNDWHSRFGDDFDAIVAAARIRGFHHIAWVDYRTQVGYTLPGSGGVASNYSEMNRILGEKLASGWFPDVRRWQFDMYTSGAAGWFHSDGVHERTLGSWGVADWISRHVRAFDDRPCVQPWSVGGSIEQPCPNPDLVVGARGVPDIAALYPGVG